MMNRRNSYLIGLTAVFLLAAFLRFYLLDAQSFWNDEGNSARLSERSIRLIIEGTASDIHPPLYYLLLRGWRVLVGESEFALRAFSTFAGLLTVAITAVFTHKLTGNKTAVLITALFLAVHPALIYYSQETRMYSLLGLWSVLSTYLLWLWLKRPLLKTGIFYSLVCAAGLYTHYFFPVVLGIHGVLVLSQVGDKTAGQLRRLIRNYALFLLATMALYAPWLPIFLDQFGDDPVVRPAFGAFFQQVAQWLFVGETFAQEVRIGFGLLLALVLITAVFTRHRAVWFLETAVLLPILFNYSLGTTDAAFLKFYIITVPLLGILVGLVAQLPKVGWAVAGLLLLGLLPQNWTALQNMYFSETYARANYRWMAERILLENHPNAGVILDAPNQWEAFTYYYADEGNVYPLPKGRTFPTPEEIDAALTPIAEAHDRLYAIFWGEAQRDPERLVERWLDEHTFKATDEWVGDVRFVTYAVPTEPATEMETAVNLPFGDQIELLGYTLNQTEFLPGDIVQLTLFWQTETPIDKRYKVFLHIVDETGAIVAQRDSEPGGGLALTPGWVPMETVRDNHGILLPTGITTGRYQIRLGLYDFANPNDRLLIELETGLQDGFILPDIRIGE